MKPRYRIWSTLLPLVVCLLLPAAATGQVDLTSPDATVAYNGAIFNQGSGGVSSGTGIFDPFYRIKGAVGVVEGVNTDAGSVAVQFETEGNAQWTTSLLLSTVTQVEIGGIKYREFFLDINQIKNADVPYELQEIEIFSDDQSDLNCFIPNAPGAYDDSVSGCDTAPSAVLDWWLDSAGDTEVLLDYDLEAGSGNRDMRLLVPDAEFTLINGLNCDYGQEGCETYIYLYSKFETNDDGFEEWSTAVQPFVQISKNGSGTVDIDVDWDIEKVVSPESCALFAGEDCVASYDVTVTRSDTPTGAQVTGVITLVVPDQLPDGDENAISAEVTGLEDIFEGVDATSISCSVGALPFTIDPGETVTCDYVIDLPDELTGINEATATILDREGNPVGFSTTWPIGPFSINYTGEPIEIDVDDDWDINGGVDQSFGPTSSTQTFEYDRQFACSTTIEDYTDGHYQSIYDNRAEIRQTDDFDDASVTVDCYAPTASKTADAEFTRTYEWTIDKSVDVSVHNLNIGTTGDSNYLIDLVQTGYTDTGHSVWGTITVNNPHPTEAMDVTLADALDDLTVASLDCGGALSIPAGGSDTCDYSATPGDDSATLNTATISLGALDVEATASVSFTMNEVDDEVNIDDDFDIDGGVDQTFGPYTGSASPTYPRTFDCPADPELYTGGMYSYVKENRATIRETGDYDDESVTVNCFIPTVSKDASSSLTRTYEWTIEKTVDPGSHNLFAGDSDDSDYTVTVTNSDIVDSDWYVWGTITVQNPNPDAAMLVSLADALNDGTVADLSACGGSLNVPAGGQATCDYTADPADGSATLNTVTGTLNGIDFDAEFAFDYEAGTINEINPTVNVTDDFDNGGPAALGSVFYGDSPGVFEYPRTFECSSDPVDYTNGHYAYQKDNTAEITETGQSDDASVTVDCWAPVVSKDASTAKRRTWHWEITKDVDPALHQLFIGSAASSDYLITLDKTGFTDDEFVVSGTIEVVNYSPLPMSVSVADVLNDGGATAATLDCGGVLDIDPEGVATCDYSAALADESATLNTATVSLNGIDFEATAPVDFAGAQLEEIDAEVNVSDDWDIDGAIDGQFGPFSDDATIPYSREFECSSDIGAYTDGTYSYVKENRASIDETGASDDASVTVECYAPSISKNVGTGLTRTYHWTIEKTVDPDAHALFAGEDADSDYTVTVTNTGFTDSDWLVAGTITVNNPHPSADLEVLLSDELSDGTAAVLDCASPLTVPSGGSADCGYSAEPVDGSSDANTVSFMLNGLTFDDVQPYDWELGEVIEVHPEVDVTDDFDGQGPAALGSVHYSASPGVFEYPRTFECSSDPADYTDGHYAYSKANTAEITQTGQSDDANVDVDCYAPVVAKTAETALIRTHLWDIDKSVTPAVWNLFTGDSGTSDYDVVVTKTGTEDSGWGVLGTITVDNPHPTADMPVSIADMLSTGESADVDCGAEDPAAATVAAAGTLECSYMVDGLPSGDERTNTVTVTMNTIDFTDDALVDFTAAEVTDINPTVDVNDTNGMSWPGITDSQTFEYSRTFGCDADEGEHANTATIVQTGQNSSADVMVNCYDITVTKDADEWFTREYDWVIDKWAEPAGGGEPVTELVLAVNQSYTLMYNVEVDLAVTPFVDSDWSVTGEITVSNADNPIPALINDVSDLITAGDIPGTVECGVAFPYEIAAGGSLVCDYSADLPGADDRLNTATAELQNHDYDSAGIGTPAGTRDIDGSADIVFGDPTTVLDACTDVSDPMGGGLLGTACMDEQLPKLFTYLHELNITAAECDGFAIDNTATQVEQDTEEFSEAVWSIWVDVPCPDGCTLTQGYWKTHNESFKGGASKKADITWFDGLGDYDEDGVIEGELEDFPGSSMSWFDVFWTAPKGNAYYNLAHQWMAAYLNCANVNPEQTPDCAVVATELADAEDFFLNNGPDAVGKGKGKNKALAQQLIGWAGTLGSFNEGEIGPGHCDEDGYSAPDGTSLVRLPGSVDAAVAMDEVEAVEENPEVVREGDELEVRVGESGDSDREYTEDEAYQRPVESVELTEVSEIAEIAPMETPDDFAVGNYPNPFNPTTTIQVAVPEASHVRVAVYDMLGRLVTTLVDGSLSAGTHSVTFDASSLPSGVYLYRFEHAGGAITKTMQLLK